MKISDVLHEAADRYLACSLEEHQAKYINKTLYSCTAILLGKTEETNYFPSAEFNFIESLGCPTWDDPFSDLFENDDSLELTQGARYLWLKFAALVAEDEGL